MGSQRHYGQTFNPLPFTLNRREDASRWEVEAGRAMAIAELKDEEMRLLREELSLEAAHRRSSEDDRADLHGEEELERVKTLLDAEVLRREEAQAALDAARGELEKAQSEGREAQKRAEQAQGDAEKARGDAGRAQQRAEDAEKALYEARDELERRSGQLEMLKKSAAMAEEMQVKLWFSKYVVMGAHAESMRNREHRAKNACFGCRTSSRGQ